MTGAIKNEERLGALLDEAKALITGDRRADYGGVVTSFTDAATMWSIVLGKRVTPEQVCLCMVALKLCREKASHKRDNLADICGYAALADFLNDQ